MTHRVAAGLLLVTVLNAALGVVAFWFGAFATSPDSSDATMNVGYYAVWTIVVSAGLCAVLPWILAFMGRVRAAWITSSIPALLTAIVILLFLTLDSWIRSL